MSKFRIGIIGAGRMGLTHLSLLQSDPRVEVVSVAEPSRLVRVVLRRNLRCRLYKSARRLLESDSLDGVVICTPPTLHYDMVNLAFERGIHVFCEKPFTASSSQATELADKFESAGLANQVGYVNRFNDVFLYIRHLLDSDVIGRVREYKTEMLSRTVVRPQEESTGGWRASHNTGGGVTYEMASHAIDLVNFFLDNPRSVAGTAMKHVHSTQVEDIVSTTLIHDDDLKGSLFVDWTNVETRKPTNTIEFIGDHGRIEANQYAAKVDVDEPNRDFGLQAGSNTRYITDVFRPVPFYVRGNEFTRQLVHFVDNVSGAGAAGHSAFRNAAETLHVMESMFADEQAKSRH